VDERPLAVEPAPRRQPPVDGPSGAGLSIAFFNHPNYDVLIECLPSQGEARHAPVLSGEYRDTKYAKTGFTTATV
jgi:isopenicillin N synthase-like dioxygenase